MGDDMQGDGGWGRFDGRLWTDGFVGVYNGNSWLSKTSYLLPHGIKFPVARGHVFWHRLGRWRT